MGDMQWRVVTRCRSQHANQYAAADKHSKLTWMFLNSLQISHAGSPFVCWELRPEASGVHTIASGRHRINWKGRKRLAYHWVYEQFIGDIPKGFDVSHRCHNPRCWRPKCLVLETRSVNKTRDFCGGWVIINDVQALRLCDHLPPCRVAHSATIAGARVTDIPSDV